MLTRKIVLGVLLLAPCLHAQTRVLTGINLSVDYGNKSVGAQVGIEQPFAKRFEVDLYDTASPIESHIALGSGWANIATLGGIGWLIQRIGIQADLKQSRYSVTSASKAAYYLTVGPVVRFRVENSPSRILFSYYRQVANGISSNGTESSRLHGVSVAWDIRAACNAHACLRINETLDVGRVLDQGNPANDSAAAAQANGQAYHPRIGVWSGGFSGTIAVEFGGKGEF